MLTAWCISVRAYQWFILEFITNGICKWQSIRRLICNDIRSIYSNVLNLFGKYLASTITNKEFEFSKNKKYYT